MAFTNIPNGNLQVGAPLRSVDILALRDNIPAVMNGDTGAPKIKAAAFQGQFGAAPVFAARAWVNFNADTINPVVIRASGNVSSITRVASGVYDVSFFTAMPDINYCVTMGEGQALIRSTVLFRTGVANSTRFPPTVNGFRVVAAESTNTSYRPEDFHIAIFR